ncbi:MULTISPECIES: hypothetical protein [Hyphomonas]|uniref:N-terminal of MaoC-like dehydratase domain-containing protein n=1 Tax=Hyphomonas adhaerens TaxID=81029 RepID=A0A3B9H157_9PROT|nr:MULTISPECIES: hypothetical protein [Hyphomonas]MBB40419.1 hypothetical protein [Hyphomonas sp.]HAE28437.1 hypothetical protein [Hyphomonas adhaerens]|tara:strand:- start:2163 stop:3122 length:960 start_codon:yes stop_codon:yes gene_type:complete
MRHASPFEAEIQELEGVLKGPLRSPRQMLGDQTYDDHASIHDDATAQKLGFQGGTIEGPTHYSLFAPLGFAVWGQRFLEQGCLSVHYRNPAFEGEQLRGFLKKGADENHAEIWAEKPDGVEVLRGSASVGQGSQPTALEQRLKSLSPLERPVIMADLTIGMKTGRVPVRMGFDQHMGDLYPFTLSQKLGVITEPSPWYTGSDTPWGRPIIPFEMLSVLLQYTARIGHFPVREPVVGLFADQEIRLIDGPLFVDEAYEVERELVALSGSRRTESFWVMTRAYRVADGKHVASMLLNQATLKESYAPYEAEYIELYGTETV